MRRFRPGGSKRASIVPVSLAMCMDALSSKCKCSDFDGNATDWLISSISFTASLPAEVAWF
jgi:hypothetical protein